MEKDDKFDRLAKEIYHNTWNGIDTIYTYRKFEQYYDYELDEEAIYLDNKVLTRKEFQALPEYQASRYQHSGQVSLRYLEGDNSKGVIEYATYGERVDCRKLFSKMFSDFIREYNIRKPFSLYKHLRFDGEDLSENSYQVYADKLIALRNNRLLGVFK
jgi:hypothetical protein